MLKVVMTTTYWKGSKGGGIKTYLINLIEELERRGIKVDIIFKEGEDSHNYIVDEESRLIFPLKVISAFLKIRKLRPDIVHSHGGMYYYLVASYFYKHLYGCKLIYTFHTEPSEGLPLLKKTLLQLMLNRCDRVTFVSKALELKIRQLWGLRFKNSAITYAGVTFKEIHPDRQTQFRKRYGLADDSVIILALGLTALKYKAEGLNLLIKAIKIAKKSSPNIVLVATRDGDYLDYSKNFAKHEGVEKEVIFTGDVDDPYIPLAICRIYAHISLGEGLPIALLEAMAMGKPIIATPVGGIPEAIENGINGILVEPNSEEIAKKILYLLNDEIFASNIALNAAKTAEYKFSWKNSADRFLQIYTKV